MDNLNNEIGDNLYAFYDQLATIGHIPKMQQDQWAVINNIKGCWPRIIYRIDPQIAGQPSPNNFSEKINSADFPQILVASDENIRETDPFLRTKGFYPFTVWRGMAFSDSKITDPVLPLSVEIIKAQNAQDIDQWCEIVAQQLLIPELLDKSLVENLMVQPSFEVFLLKSNGIGVSTMLVFRTENSTGLYLIATKKSDLRQGFASMLVRKILFLESQKSINPIILHATSKGEALYLKLGFKPFNQFFLYRFINTHL